MKKIRAAIVGYGNIGHFVLDALQVAPDFEIAGIVRRRVSEVPMELSAYPVVSSLDELKDVDVAILCMGHTVAVKAIAGVKAALSMTIPLGTGIHRRMVYIELEEGYTFEEVAHAIKTDDYFAHDETHVMQVESVDALKDMGHGVNMTRKGVSGKTQNQRFEFNMSINNPALTAQVLVCTARAAMLQRPGCYTLIEIPVIDLLYGDRDELVRRLV